MFLSILTEWTRLLISASINKNAFTEANHVLSKGISEYCLALFRNRRRQHNDFFILIWLDIRMDVRRLRTASETIELGLVLK